MGSPLRADARASAARESLKRRAAALAALVLAACGAPTPPPEAPPPAVVVPAPPAPAPPQATAPSPARTPLDRYKRAVAHVILQANTANTYDGVPPHMLRAVIVLQLTVDGRGALTDVKTLRSRSAEHAAAATKSVRAAGPLPAPPRELLRSGRLEFVETWLFRDDGKFQVRSVAQPQVAVVD